MSILLQSRLFDTAAVPQQQRFYLNLFK